MLIFEEIYQTNVEPQKAVYGPPCVGELEGLTSPGSGNLLVAKHHDPEQSAKPPGRWT